MSREGATWDAMCRAAAAPLGLCIRQPASRIQSFAFPRSPLATRITNTSTRACLSLTRTASSHNVSCAALAQQGVLHLFRWVVPSEMRGIEAPVVLIRTSNVVSTRWRVSRTTTVSLLPATTTHSPTHIGALICYGSRYSNAPATVPHHLSGA
jgi:hypothetical protein